MQDKILYFQCNDRRPTPKEASKFIAHISVIYLLTKMIYMALTQLKNG